MASVINTTRSLVASNFRGFDVVINRTGIRRPHHDEVIKEACRNDTIATASAKQILVHISTLGHKLLPGHYDNLFKLVDLERGEVRELTINEGQRLWSEKFSDSTVFEIPCTLTNPVKCFVDNL